MWSFLEKAVTNLSEIVAPITNTNQLYLAILNGRNSEAHYLIDMESPEFNIRGLMDSGTGAIHLAARFNNKDVLDSLTNKGVSIHLLDTQGCTPLHYACKYGHVGMCKYLIDQGANILTKNHAGQSAYDVAESHSVRQYLLPLTFKEESELQGTPQGEQYVYANPFAANTRDTSTEYLSSTGGSGAPAPGPPPMMGAAVGLGGSDSNPYAASAGSLQRPTYAQYTNPYAQPDPVPVSAQQPQQAVPEVVPAPASTPTHVSNPYAQPDAASVAVAVSATLQTQAPVVVAAPVMNFLRPPTMSTPTSTSTVAAAATHTATQVQAVGQAPAASGSFDMSNTSRPVYVSHSPLNAMTSSSRSAPTSGDSGSGTGTVAGSVTDTETKEDISAQAPVPAPIPAHVFPAYTNSSSFNASARASVSTVGGMLRPNSNGSSIGSSIGSGSGTTTPPTTSVSASLTPSPAVQQQHPPPKHRFVPDGFHSSSNDPNLQKLYGHQIQVKNVAPPPIFASPPPQMSSSSSSSSSFSGGSAPTLSAPTFALAPSSSGDDVGSNHSSSGSLHSLNNTGFGSGSSSNLAGGLVQGQAGTAAVGYVGPPLPNGAIYKQQSAVPSVFNPAATANMNNQYTQPPPQSHSEEVVEVSLSAQSSAVM